VVEFSPPFLAPDEPEPGEEGVSEGVLKLNLRKGCEQKLSRSRSSAGVSLLWRGVLQTQLSCVKLARV
jgi:hypothetical protein